MTKITKVKQPDVFMHFMKSMQRFWILITLSNSLGLGFNMYFLTHHGNLMAMISLFSFAISLFMLLILFFIDLSLSFGRYAVHLMEDVNLLNNATYYYFSSAVLGASSYLTVQGAILGFIAWYV